MTVSFEAEERTLAAMARGASPAEACAEGPMSLASLQRRLRQDDFVVRLDLKKEVVSGEIDDQLRALMRLGVDVLAKVLKLENNPKLQLAAVRMLMPIWLRTRDFEIEAHVSRLEETAAAQQVQLDAAAAMIEQLQNNVLVGGSAGLAGGAS